MNRTKVTRYLAAAIFFSFLIVIATGPPAEAMGKKKKDLFVRVVGTAVGELEFVPDIDGDGIDDIANCFTIEIRSLDKDKKIGDATECINFDALVGDGFASVNTTTLRIKKDEVTVRHLVTIQPITTGLSFVTHIVGSFPGSIPDFSGLPPDLKTGILGGTHKYKQASGDVRMSGGVDLTFVDSRNEIHFDSIYLVRFN